MIRTTIACLAAVAALSAAAPAAARTDPPAAVAGRQDAEFEAREALVRRFFEVSQFEKLTNTMMESMVAPMLSDSRIPADKVPVVREAFLEAFGNVMPQMMDAYVEQYAGTFTLQELEELVAFYESPTGRSVMAKTLTLSRQAGDMIERFQPLMEAEMRRQLCARIDCPAPAAEPPVIVAPSRR